MLEFRRGDRVRLTQDHQVLHLVDTIKAGETGILTSIYRIQDGEIIWRMVLDRGPFIAVPHTKIEKC